MRMDPTKAVSYLQGCIYHRRVRTRRAPIVDKMMSTTDAQGHPSPNSKESEHQPKKAMTCTDTKIPTALSTTTRYSRLMRWNYEKCEPSEVLFSSSEGEADNEGACTTYADDVRGGETNREGSSSASFVFCFPGDRLPSQLENVKYAALTAREVREVNEFLSSRVVGSFSSSSPSSFSSPCLSSNEGVIKLNHVLSLQEPSVIATTLEAIFKGTMEKEEGSSRVPERSSSTPTPASPSDLSTPFHDSHYFIVFGQTITSQGFSVYSQLFDAGELTRNGEPTRGTYVPSSGSANDGVDGNDGVPTSLRTIGSIIRYALAEGDRPTPFPAVIGRSPERRITTMDEKKDDPHHNPQGLLNDVERRRLISLDLVGFSKGCTALNQLVADVGAWGAPITIATEIERSGDEGSVPSTGPEKADNYHSTWRLGVHYVDGGLNSVGAFIKERSCLEAFRKAFISPCAQRSTRSILPNSVVTKSREDHVNLDTSTGSTYDRSVRVPPLLLTFRGCSSVTYSVYSTPRQRMDPHRPFLDYERRMMSMHLCGVQQINPASFSSSSFPIGAPPQAGASLFAFHPSRPPAGGAVASSISPHASIFVPTYFTLRNLPHTRDGEVGGGGGGGGDFGADVPQGKRPFSTVYSEPIRDWAVTTVEGKKQGDVAIENDTDTPHDKDNSSSSRNSCRFVVRVLEDVPSMPTTDGGSDDHDHDDVPSSPEEKGAMIGLKQHMMALIRFGQKQ